MGCYSVELSRSAEKALRKLPRDDLRRIAAALKQLESDPRPQGSRKLSGYDDVLRIRVGRYRIIYNIIEERVLVIVLKIGHRQDVYR
ncbi:MAG: type II toxin-antitoxin system RelE/ParE family toxin [Proteobacteria bacterium]|nr:type II toxin-antitoxin system RelE/ParE family toxin [Pseudomonadota bacterium]